MLYKITVLCLVTVFASAVPTKGITTDTTRCEEKCRDEGYCCNDPAVGSNQLLSCAQACMIRARDGAGTCGMACDAQAASRGCSRTVSGNTYGMCSSCSDLDASSARCRWGVPSVDACHAGCAIAPQGAKDLKAKVTGAASNDEIEAYIKSYVDRSTPNRVKWQVKIETGLLALRFDEELANGVTIRAGTPCETYNWHIHAKSTGPGADRCGVAATGGHVDNGFACGGASQYADTTCKALNYKEPYAERCTTGKQSGCEYGDLSGKMGKIPVTTGETFEFEDNHLQRLENYDGTSIVLHCCVSAKKDNVKVQSCKQRVACGDLTLS